MTTVATTPATLVTPPPSVVQLIEQHIEAFITEVITGVEHLISDVVAALSKASQLVPVAANAVEDVATFVEGLPGVAANPTVAALVAGVDVAAKGLDAFASTWTQATTGGGVTATVAKAAVTNLYQTYQDTISAAAQAKSAAIAAAQSPVVTPIVTAPTQPAAS